jgi:histidyl-tRNA synthetase
MSIIQAVRGTRDFYPEEMAARQWLYGKIREVSERFGYQEYDGPFLERLELYAAKSGEELVNEQSYVFADRSGTMVTLRPELTLSLARMVAQRSKALIPPLRWWSFGPFWRYERTQKGRSREFFQWNIDLIGVDSAEADAEIVAVGASLFRAIGLSPEVIRIKVNNRKLAESELERHGLPQTQRQLAFKLIDRREKMDEAAWRAYASESGLDEGGYDALTRYIENLQAGESSAELVPFFEACAALGIEDYVEFDPTVIRGLDYYTGTVYEARDSSGNHRSILGGGRYDNLVADVGGEKMPGTGFAMGDVVIGLVLEEYGAAPELRSNPADVFVTTFDETTQLDSMRLAAMLRAAGLDVEWYPEPVKLARQLKHADRSSIPLAVILGPEEIAVGKATLKDLRQGTQNLVEQDALASHISQLLLSTFP